MRYLFDSVRYTVLTLLCFPGSVLMAQHFDEAPINYSITKASNSISRLQDKLDSKSITFEFEDHFGFLQSVLHHLDIPYDSQILVFAKTSFQNRLITPSTPRAIYFNDDTYIGTVQNGDVIELSTTDPVLGAVFYTIAQDKSKPPQFTRMHHDCMQCHASSLTRGIPGHVVRSVFPNEQGFPILKMGSHITTQDSPLEERWGGWYVTGTHGSVHHMGNTIAKETNRGTDFDPENGSNVVTLHQRVQQNKYLTSHSDIVSLMVIEHQTQMQNLITSANFETRNALYTQSIMDDLLEQKSETLSDSTRRRIANAGNKLVDYMLFVNELKLTYPIKGTSGFAQEFTERGPHDSQGRSLRDFDLKERLFKYPLSYLIYSSQFNGLPKEMKQYVYQRLWDILTGAIVSEEYHHLTQSKRRAIRQILIETKSDLPDYWIEQF